MNWLPLIQQTVAWFMYDFEGDIENARGHMEEAMISLQAAVASTRLNSIEHNTKRLFKDLPFIKQQEYT